MQEPELRDFAVDSIDDPDNPSRESFDQDALEALMQSMSASGLRQPIGLVLRANSSRGQVSWGHRRTVAARKLGWPTIKAFVYPHGTDPMTARIEENFVRDDLNPREEARCARDLYNQHGSIYDVARIMRRSRPWVEQRLELLAWPQILQDAAASRDLGLGVCAALAQVDHIDYLTSLVKEAARTGATRRTVDTWVAHYAADRDRIIANHETVQQIIERRDHYTVMASCEVCGEAHPILETALLRACKHCLDQLDEAKREEAQAHRA